VAAQWLAQWLARDPILRFPPLIAVRREVQHREAAPLYLPLRGIFDAGLGRIMDQPGVRLELGRPDVHERSALVSGGRHQLLLQCQLRAPLDLVRRGCRCSANGVVLLEADGAAILGKKSTLTH